MRLRDHRGRFVAAPDLDDELLALLARGDIPLSAQIERLMLELAGVGSVDALQALVRRGLVQIH